MGKSRVGQECIRCRKKFRKGDQVYLVKGCNAVSGAARSLCFTMCTPCADEHVTEHTFVSYMIYVGGVE